MEVWRAQVSGDSFLNVVYLRYLVAVTCIILEFLLKKRVFVDSSKEKSLVLFNFPARSSPASRMLL